MRVSEISWEFPSEESASHYFPIVICSLLLCANRLLTRFALGGLDQFPQRERRETMMVAPSRPNTSQVVCAFVLLTLIACLAMCCTRAT